MDDQTKLSIRSFIRTVPDYPKPGINFRDIAPLLADGPAFSAATNQLAALIDWDRVDLVAGIESRGFIFASALAYKARVGQIILRKPGKLPGTLIGQDYDLEYGSARLEVQADAVQAGQRVLLVDDLLATGGTAMAGAQLLRSVGGVVDQTLFLIELSDLPGRNLLAEKAIETKALIGFRESDT